MKHKWKNNVCVVCGCKRTRLWYAEWAGYTYTRSGIIANNLNSMQCIIKKKKIRKQ
jgi:hypothetical protein